MKTRTLVFSLAAILFSLVAPLHAQQYAVPWFKIAGGGAMQSTGGVYTLSATIGQSDAGRVASTNNAFRIEGGFWGIAIQQAGYPKLTITRSGTNALVSWVTPETGFVLQNATDLATPTQWTDSSFAVGVNGTTHTVTVPLSWAPEAFFRLRRP